MAIERIPEVPSEAVAAIRNKTAFVLPDNPTAAGYTAADIKRHFYEAITDALTSEEGIDDLPESAVALVQWLRNRVNEALDGVESAVNSKADATETAAALASKANTSDVNTALGTKLDKFTTTENSVRLHGAWYNSQDGVIQGSITPYGNRVMVRDANGRSQVNTPTLGNDIANKAYVDSMSGAVTSVNGQTGAVILGADDLGAAPVVGGKIPASYIPGSYDDVIEGYYYNLKFYTSDSHTTEITGESGKLYVDIPNNKSYRYTGSGYTAISDFDPSTIIVQETGSAQDKVMSQKAVTSALMGMDIALASKANKRDVNTAIDTVKPLVVETSGYYTYDNSVTAPYLTYAQIQDLINAHQDGRPCFVKQGNGMHTVVSTSQNWLLLQSSANDPSSFLDITYYAYDTTNGDKYVRAYSYKAIPKTQFDGRSGAVVVAFEPHAYCFYGYGGLSSLTITSFEEPPSLVEEPFWSISFKAASSGITVTFPNTASQSIVWLGGIPSFKAGHVYMLMFTKHPIEQAKFIGVWGESV